MEQLTLIREKNIIVYGAGAVARVIIPYLSACDDIFRLLGIALTSTNGMEEYKDTGLPVHNINEWKEISPGATILIATSYACHADIANLCRSVGYEDIVPLTPQLKDAITFEYFSRYLAGKGVNLTGEYIDLGNMRFINPVHTMLKNGVNLFTQLGDLVFPHLFSDWTSIAEGPYDRKEGELKPGDIVLDCGANMGVFSVYAASKGCTCYAFEPTPELQPIIKQHSFLSKNTIFPIEAAVSDTVGTAMFHLNSYSFGGNSLMERGIDKNVITVKTVTVDSFVAEQGLHKVDFIKADVEGAERLMLKGAWETLRKFAPRLSLCTYHLPDDGQVLRELILEANPNYVVDYQYEKLYAHV